MRSTTIARNITHVSRGVDGLAAVAIGCFCMISIGVKFGERLDCGRRYASRQIN